MADLTEESFEVWATKTINQMIARYDVTINKLAAQIKASKEQTTHLQTILNERDIQYPLKERSEHGSYLFKRCYNCDEPLDYISSGELLSEPNPKQSQIFSCTNPQCEIQQITISEFVKEKQ